MNTAPEDPAGVGVVLVSHSRALAEAAADLACRIGPGEPVVHAVGGTGEGGLGTDPDRLAETLGRADRGAGAVLIPDLGSSVLAARAVLAETPEPERFVLVDAPFVEGAVAAAIAAAAGLDRHAVAAAARQTRAASKF